MGILFWNFISQWGSCAQAKFPLIHSPTIQGFTVENTLREFPSMPKLSRVWQTQDGTSRVLFTLYSSRKWCTDRIWHGGRYTDWSMHPRWTNIYHQTEIPVPPWRLVLGFPHTTSTLTRLIWTTLGCATCCTWYDHPRWSCISRLTSHWWHWSWSVVILNSCPMLELMGSK